MLRRDNTPQTCNSRHKAALLSLVLVLHNNVFDVCAAKPPVAVCLATGRMVDKDLRYRSGRTTVRFYLRHSNCQQRR
jgi:hypothetical protein